MVGTDGVADFGLLLVLLGELHAQQGVGQVGILFRNLADIVQQAGPFGDSGIQTQFGGHDGADVGHLAGVLEKVLPVGRTVFHPADQADQLHAEPVDAQVDAGAFAGFQDFLFQLLLHLGDDFFDAGRMDAAVDDQLVQGQAGHFAAHRVEGGKEDGVGGVVHHEFHAGRGLQGPDVAALTADDATLDFVVFDREGGDGVLDSRFRRGALDGVDNDAFGFLGRVQTGFVQAVVDVGLGLCTGFRLHVFHQLVLGLQGGHPGDAFDLVVGFGLQADILFFLVVEQFLLIFQGRLDAVGLFVLAVQFAHLLVYRVLLLLDAGFGLADLGIALVDGLFVLALETEELFLGLENLFVLDLLGLDFRFFQDFVPFSLEDGLADQYIDRQGNHCAGDKSDN